MNTNDLITRHAALWEQATHGPFLVGVKSGNLPQAAFERWLMQDYLFVQAGLRAQCLLLARAPRRDQSLLAQGVTALTAELDWFEEQLRAHGLPAEVGPLPTCRAYSDFLLVQALAPYPAALTVVTTVEHAYERAWSGVRPGAAQYREFVDHWTMPAFASYVGALIDATDQALAGASSDEQRQAEDAFVWTARYEAVFWQMAFEAAEEG